jgi:hypothetical protein
VKCQCKDGTRLALMLAGATVMLGMTLIAAAVVSAQQAGPQNAVAIPNPTTWAPTVDWSAISTGQSLSLAPAIQSAPEAAVVFGQNVFNLDKTVLSQNDTTVVFDPLNPNRVVGGYHDLRAVLLTSTPLGGDFTGWSISTNGSTPSKDGQLQSTTIAGVKVPSGAGPVLSVDSAGDFFMTSVYYNWKQPTAFKLSGPNGIVIVRSPKAGSQQGVFSAACTGGDGNLNCWPTLKVVNGENCISAGGHFNDRPYIAADSSSSVAKGSVYVVWPKIGCATSDHSSAIVISKCTNTLSSCSTPVVLESTSGTGANIDILEIPHLTVSPVNGKVYVTWNKFFGSTAETESDTIRMAVITPSASATSLGTVSPLHTVVTETQPIPLFAFPFPAAFRTVTYAKVGIKGGRAVVVWDRRTTTNLFNGYYFDSDILARYSDNDGATFSANQLVSAAGSFQNQPSICVDPVSTRVVVAYYSAQNDTVSKHRRDVYIATSPTGAAPYTPLRVTPVSNITENNPIQADTYMGDKIEAACGPKFAYVHYTANYALKNVAPFDTPNLFIPQQDNFLAKVTLP